MPGPLTQVLFGANTLQPSGTVYSAIMGLLPAGWGTEASARTPWPAPGVLRNLVVDLSAAPGGVTSRTFTLRVNGAGTALTVTVSGTATTARLTGTAVTVAAGDLVALQHTSSGSPAAATVRWSLEFEGTTANESGYTSALGLKNSTVSPVGAGLFAGTALSTPGSLDLQNIVAASGTLTGTRVAVSSAPGVGNGFTFYVNKNGVRQDGGGGTVNTACALVGALTSASATYSLPLAGGDLVYLEAVVSGSFGSLTWSSGVAFVATTDGQSQVCGNANSLSASVTEYCPAPQMVASKQTSETAFLARALAGVTTIRLSGFRARLNAAPDAGTSRTLELRVDGASVGPAVTFTAGETSDSDLASTVDLADLSLWNLRSTVTGSTTSRHAAWSCIQGPATAAGTEARWTQLVAETLTLPAPPAARLTQLVAETLTGAVVVPPAAERVELFVWGPF